MFCSFLKEGRIPPLKFLIPEIENFLKLSPREQSCLIIYGRKVPEIKQLLEQYLPLEESIKRFLLKGKIKEVSIPVVTKDGKGKITKAYLIENSQQTWTNLREYLSVLSSKLENLIGKKFIILFEEAVEGYSFLLPLAVALLKPSLLSKYCFSGNIDIDGKLLPVKGIEAKEYICKTYGKLLITSNDFENKNLKYLLDFLSLEFKPIPLFISTKGRPLEVVEKNYALLKGNLNFFASDKLLRRILKEEPCKDLGILEFPEDWKRALNLFKKWIELIDASFEDAELHIALDGPAPLAFAYGIMHGTHKRAVFYHFQGSKYHPQVVINEETSRQIKFCEGNFKWIDWKFIPLKETKNTKTLAVVLDMVSHSISEKVKEFLKFQKLESDILLITHKERGNLTINRLWTEDIAETFSVIEKYKKPYKEILFFLGTPVAFAFGLGAAFGHYAKGSIYSYYRDKEPPYVEVLKLEEIEKIR